jgi:hypothetical protein
MFTIDDLVSRGTGCTTRLRRKEASGKTANFRLIGGEDATDNESLILLAASHSDVPMNVKYPDTETGFSHSKSLTISGQALSEALTPALPVEEPTRRKRVTS